MQKKKFYGKDCQTEKIQDGCHRHYKFSQEKFFFNINSKTSIAKKINHEAILKFHLIWLHMALGFYMSSILFYIREKNHWL